MLQKINNHLSLTYIVGNEINTALHILFLKAMLSKIIEYFVHTS